MRVQRRSSDGTSQPGPRARAGLALLAALLLAALLAPAGASAHAQLESTSPGRDALVRTEPARVTFTFGEPVTGTAGAVRVYDTKGDRVDDGNAGHTAGNPKTFGVGLKPGLPDGTYTATYRIVSADTHVVTGGFSFSIGTRSAGGGRDVGQLLAGQRTGAVTTDAFIVVRALQYGAIAVALGGVLFLLLVLLPAAAALGLPGAPGGARDAPAGDAGAADGEPPADDRPADDRSAAAPAVRRLRLAVGVAAAVGLVVSVAGLGLEGAEEAGVSFGNAFTGAILGDVLGTRFGVVWLAAAGAWLLAGGLALAWLRATPGRTSLWLLAAPLLALTLLPGLAGHASVQSPTGLNLVANVLHVNAMALWVGGLAALLLALPAATRALAAPADRTRLLAGSLSRFSPLALACVAVLLVTGIVQSLTEIDAWSQLLHTAYGRAVSIKFLLLLVLAGLGAVNRQRTVPRLRALARDGGTPGETGIVLRRTLRAEVAIVAVVILVTGALAGYPPAKTASTGPVSVTTTIGPAQLQLTVDPARVGANEMHVYLLDPRSGAPSTATKQLTMTATLPAKGIGPLPLPAEHAGPGHYVVTGAVLGAPGTWTIHVTDRVSAFDEFDRDVKVGVH